MSDISAGPAHALARGAVELKLAFGWRRARACVDPRRAGPDPKVARAAQTSSAGSSPASEVGGGGRG
ncbi:hypothetical protein MMSP_3749 [Mycobacterium sp. 012931]|nr:hypothetical protein MMSP_3749 [Mycobacterium sp. 012931]